MVSHRPIAREPGWRRRGHRLIIGAPIRLWQGGLTMRVPWHFSAALMWYLLFTPPAAGQNPFKYNENREAGKAFWTAILAFDDLSVTRRELLWMCKHVAKELPDHEYGVRAKAMTAILEKMVAEDEEFARRAAKADPTAQPTLQDGVAELIFHLRDQHGRQLTQPGLCNIFGDVEELLLMNGEDGSNGPTPAHQLVAIGYDAVPQLIAALDDDCFCRSVQRGPTTHV